MKITTAIALIVALVGFLITLDRDDKKPTPSPQKETTGTSRKPLVLSHHQDGTPVQPDELVVRKESSLGGYVFRDQTTGEVAFDETFIFAEPFKNGYARVVNSAQRYVTINELGEVVPANQLPQGAGWPKVSVEDNSSGVAVYLRPDGLPLNPTASDDALPDGFNPKATSNSVVRIGDKSYFLGKSQDGPDVFIGDQGFMEIHPERYVEGQERSFFVVTSHDQRIRLLDSEVLPYLRNPEMERSLPDPPDYFGENGILRQPPSGE